MKKVLVLLLPLLLLAASCNKQAPAQSSEQLGTIYGTTIYPADNNIDQTICAEMVNNPTKKYCADAPAKTPKFEVKIPVGDYYVYSMTKDHVYLKDYKAYYTQYVTCGMKETCKDHSKIVVNVKPNISQEVKPWDWYQ